MKTKLIPLTAGVLTPAASLFAVRQPETAPAQAVGRDGGTPVDNNYAPPFAFNGTIKEVVVDLSPTK